MDVDTLIAHLGQFTANIDVAVQFDGGNVDYNLSVEEYPAEAPTEIRITANGDTPKIQIEDFIEDLEALTSNLPVVARIGDGPWGSVLAAIEIPDEESSTDVLLIAYNESVIE